MVLLKNSGDDYILERGARVTNTRPLSWLGEVGLIYISDYTYTFANGVSDTCYNTVMSVNCNVSESSNSWLYKNYQLFITHRQYTYTDVFMADSSGTLRFSSVKSGYNVWPSLYLNSNIKITSGDGSSENPYRLSI